MTEWSSPRCQLLEAGLLSKRRQIKWGDKVVTPNIANQIANATKANPIT